MAAAEVTVMEPALESGKIQEVRTDLLPVAMEVDEKTSSEKRYVVGCFQASLPEQLALLVPSSISVFIVAIRGFKSQPANTTTCSPASTYHLISPFFNQFY